MASLACLSMVIDREAVVWASASSHTSRSLAQKHRGKVRQPRQCPDHGWARDAPRLGGGECHVTLHFQTDKGGQLQTPMGKSCTL